MKSVTIIISHYESLPFLRTCLRQIEKFKNPEIRHNIIIADQSTIGTFSKVAENLEGIRLFHMQPLYSGFGIDYLMREGGIQTDYICQLHADAFPISDKWLLAPITLMEENNLAFSGVLQFICDGPSAIYPYKGNNVFGLSLIHI